MEKISIVETMQIEFKKIIEATGGKVDSEFMKIFDDEMQKKIEDEPKLQKSKSNSASNQAIKAPSEVAQKYYERATKGSQRRRYKKSSETFCDLD